MGVLQLPGLDTPVEVDNAAALVYATLHFCEQPGTIDQFCSFLRHHLGVAAADVPPAEVLGWLARSVWTGGTGSPPQWHT